MEQVSDRSIRISRDRHPPYMAGIISKRDVVADDVNVVLNENPGVEIIINVPAYGIWQGSGIFAAQVAGVAFGGMADLQSCIGQEDPSSHEKAEYAFIERGLRQHSRVANFIREADRLFRVLRNGLPEVRVLALYEYELSAEHLRTARERYGVFDLVLISNPNGQPTQGAARVAEEFGVELLMWGELLSRLNR